jgi:ElaB/YqjD/DUF883 family membrane-anchored ribosome-binding protein
MTDNNSRDPAAIEQDIRRTQDDMSRTVDKIGDQLTARNIFNALLDKADENNIDARYLLDGARRNPVALGLIAAGAIWLVSDKDSKFPSKAKAKGDDDGRWTFDDSDGHHARYVSHMSSVEMRDGEDIESYQRRRDIARANFLMCERRPGEDDTSFRERLDSMTEKFREKRRAWADSSSQATNAATDKARVAAGKAQDFYDSNPLVGGILAAAVGAAFGSSLPITRQEQEKLGSVGEKARDVASEQKDKVASKLHDKKDEIVNEADQKLQSSGSQQPPQRSPEFSRS